MKLTNCLTLTATALLALGMLTACQTAPKTEAANQVAAPPAANASQAQATNAATAQPGSLASPTAAYQTAYAARQKKDAKGLQQAMSKKMLGFFSEMAKAEQKTLNDEVQEMIDSPLPPTNEIRNEKITGDQATVEYQDDQGKWKTMDFVKEGKDWKLTMPDLKKQAMTQTTLGKPE